jgi:putative transposase
MARMRRLTVMWLAHWVRSRAGRAGRLFRDRLTAPDYDVYVRELARATLLNRVRVLAWCLLPDEVNLIGWPERPDSLARALAEANRRYARYYNRATRTKGALFAARYQCCVLDWPELAQAVRAVEAAPVRAGLVNKVWHWPWSSAGRRCRKVKRDPLVAEHNLWLFGRHWRSFFYEEYDEEMERRIRRCLRSGRPAGNEWFVAGVERFTGRKVLRPRRGPKGKEEEE